MADFEDIVIPDPQRGIEMHFKVNGDGLVVAVELVYENPRPLSFFINHGALWSRPPAVAGQPRPCGGGKQEG